MIIVIIMIMIIIIPLLSEGNFKVLHVHIYRWFFNKKHDIYNETHTKLR